ncbi:iron hydrogenase [Venturia nashicola]|nr:iron hydrogenase [Venturia nashicola]
MSAILSAEDLNDFISPGVACIKPIESLPTSSTETPSNPYEVTTEEKVTAENPTPAQISLTDCLACSGCVTSAEAVLVSLQSHAEVLSTLNAHPSLTGLPWMNGRVGVEQERDIQAEGKIFVATISPQTRASLAAVYGVSSTQAGNMISQFLSGPNGLASGGKHGSRFLWTLDTNTFRDAALVLAAEEVAQGLQDNELKKPILTSACPGWICYAEKTHPYILPHLSRLKSPQALAGTLVKSTLAKRFGVPVERIWHLAVMPCFDKKLEASRGELTSDAWSGTSADGSPVRDVDCVITAKELIEMARLRGLDFGSMPRTSLRRRDRVRFPDAQIDKFLFPSAKQRSLQEKTAGSSGGYLWHILQRFQAQYPGSRIKIERGRNADVVEYLLLRHNDATGKEECVFKAARYYGFRNIQNLVRRLKPKAQSRLLAAAGTRGGARRPGETKAVGGKDVEYAYVEVMACPGGCTNGGGQVKVGEVAEVRGEAKPEQAIAGKGGPQEQREWLAKVDEAYFSASSNSDDMETSDDEDDPNFIGQGEAMDIDTPPDSSSSHSQEPPEIDVVDGISALDMRHILSHWSQITDVPVGILVNTTYRKVESDVGKKKVSDVERVAGLASSLGGGW